MILLDKIKELTEAIINVDEKIGFKKFVKYASLGLIIVIFVNYKTILKDIIEIVAQIESEIHSEKLQLRDELLAELSPMLADFRSNVRADRILYFEYHNSKENLIGIPFKYIELVQQNTGYGVRVVEESRYKNINTGAITELYEDIKMKKVITCSDPYDTHFSNYYPGVYDIFCSRGNARRYVFVNVPGVDAPIGLIVLEWLNETSVFEVDEIHKTAVEDYIPRINALILSKRRD